MEVSEKVKEQYHSNSIHKNLLIEIPELGLTVSNEQICYESMKLRESILESDNIEFVGCIASVFQIQLKNILDDVKGKQIRVSISTEGTQDEPVMLFNGIIDSAKMQSNKLGKEIVAYDQLYTKGNTEVSTWYKSLTFPIRLKNVRDSLFEFIDLEQVEKVLPNDDIVIKKQYVPNSLRALAVIKAVCQINGACGIINRQGKFEYRILGKMDGYKGAYPGPLLYPGHNTFPGVRATTETGLSQTNFPFYKLVEHEEFEVCPVDKVTIRQSEDVEGVTFGDGENNYIIQGNMFAYNLSSDVLKAVAENVYNSVQGFSYHPHTTDNNGLPYLECGLDMVTYMIPDYKATFSEDNTSGGIVYKKKSFPVLSRNLKGIQNLRDEYAAKGEEYQTEFITDLQTQIDILKKKSSIDKQYVEEYVSDYTYDKDYIDEKFEGFEGGGTKIVPVKVLPENPDNTVYLIEGEVIVN